MREFIFDEVDQKILQELQKSGLNFVKAPYQELAEKLKLTESEVLHRLKILQEKKILRRIGVVLFHVKAGFQANALVAWKIDPNEKNFKKILELFQNSKDISHVYERETFDDWQYNFYTMIHAKDKKICDSIIQNLAAQTNLNDYQVFYTIKEWKKRPLDYFQN